MAKGQKLRAAVIGGGNMGKNHLRLYSVLPEAELVGLADINVKTESLAKEYRAKFFTDYKVMLEELNPDIVSVVVPTPLHHEVASHVMSHGIHCLLEKPIASSVEEADDLIAIAKKKKLVFSVGHIERYNPLIKRLKKMVVDEKRVGNVSSVVCKRVGGFPAIEPKTDVIIDLAVHDIDIINYLLDRNPNHIYSHGSRTHHSQKIDSAEILMDYGDASGFIQANWLTPVKIRTIAVTGSEGYVEGNYITQELEYYRHNMQKIKIKNDFTDFVIKMGDPEREIIKVDFEEPLAAELKAFMARVQGNQSAIVEPDAAREALRVALAATAPKP